MTSGPQRSATFSVVAELISKVQMILELLFVPCGYFTFNNFSSFIVSDVISLTDSACTG